MKLALIADLHGNWTATQALEKDLQRRNIDEIYCLGDLVGKGPSSHKTFDWVFDNCSVVIGGNWDYGLNRKLFPADGFYWEQLGQSRLDKLATLPKEHHFTLCGQHLRMIHGRPVTSDGLLNPTADPQEILPYLTSDDKTFQGLIYADWHRAFYRVLSGGLVINTGSVGNSMGVPNVFYAILEGTMGKAVAPLDVTLVSLPYNNQKAVKEALATPGLPNREAYIAEVTTGVYSR